MSRPGGLQPLATDCRCFSCTASDVGSVVKHVVAFALAVVVLASFVVWVLR